MHCHNIDYPINMHVQQKKKRISSYTNKRKKIKFEKIGGHGDIIND